MVNFLGEIVVLSTYLFSNFRRQRVELSLHIHCNTFNTAKKGYTKKDWSGSRGVSPGVLHLENRAPKKTIEIEQEDTWLSKNTKFRFVRPLNRAKEQSLIESEKIEIYRLQWSFNPYVNLCCLTANNNNIFSNISCKQSESNYNIYF